MAELKVNMSEDLTEEIQKMVYSAINESLKKSFKNDLYMKSHLSYSEVCELLDVSRNTLNMWVNSLGLKKIKVAGRQYIKRDTLLEFLDSFEK